LQFALYQRFYCQDVPGSVWADRDLRAALTELTAHPQVQVFIMRAALVALAAVMVLQVMATDMVLAEFTAQATERVLDMALEPALEQARATVQDTARVMAQVTEQAQALEPEQLDMVQATEQADLVQDKASVRDMAREQDLARPGLAQA
jgi:hypothetical protein